MVVIETDDPRLFPENMANRTAAETAELRRRVVAQLPRMTRLVFAASEREGRLMVRAHEAGMRAIGRGEVYDRPPADYVPPTRG